MSGVRSADKEMRLVDRALQMVNGARILADWIGDGGHVVGQEDAQRRADVCLKCPKHSTNYSFAEPVADTIKSQLELKKHLEFRVRGEKSLHVCSVCGCVLRLKVWLPWERIKLDEDEKPNYPASCWLLTEHQTP